MSEGQLANLRVISDVALFIGSLLLFWASLITHHIFRNPAADENDRRLWRLFDGYRDTDNALVGFFGVLFIAIGFALSILLNDKVDATTSSINGFLVIVLALVFIGGAIGVPLGARRQKQKLKGIYQWEFWEHAHRDDKKPKPPTLDEFKKAYPEHGKYFEWALKSRQSQYDSVIDWESHRYKEYERDRKLGERKAKAKLKKQQSSPKVAP
jgi:hypothetical protein